MKLSAHGRLVLLRDEAWRVREKQPSYTITCQVDESGVTYHLTGSDGDSKIQRTAFAMILMALTNEFASNCGVTLEKAYEALLAAYRAGKPPT